MQLLVWIYYDASHTDRVRSRAFIMLCCSCHIRQDGREGAAWQCWQAERGGQRSAMLVRVADIGSLCSPKYRLAVSCRVRRPLPSAGRRRRKSPCYLRGDCGRHPSHTASSGRLRTDLRERRTQWVETSAPFAQIGATTTCVAWMPSENAWTGPTCGNKPEVTLLGRPT